MTYVYSTVNEGIQLLHRSQGSMFQQSPDILRSKYTKDILIRICTSFHINLPFIYPYSMYINIHFMCVNYYYRNLGFLE